MKNLLLAAMASILCLKGSAQSDAEILTAIQKHQPLKGAKIPRDIAGRIGATHVAGKYYFSKEPYLIEGARKMSEMGYGVFKVWFRKNGGGYPYNSEWNLPKNITLKELAQHPYWAATFEFPFSTFALSVDGPGIRSTDSSARADEQEIYELTNYLLERYRDRDVTFILHNWEGDWMLRGGTGDYARWSRKAGELIRAVDGDRRTVLVPADSMQRVQAMARWFKARQDGVNRARAEVTQDGPSCVTCGLRHARTDPPIRKPFWGGGGGRGNPRDRLCVHGPFCVTSRACTGRSV